MYPAYVTLPIFSSENSHSDIVLLFSVLFLAPFCLFLYFLYFLLCSWLKWNCPLKIMSSRTLFMASYRPRGSSFLKKLIAFMMSKGQRTGQGINWHCLLSGRLFMCLYAILPQVLLTSHLTSQRFQYTDTTVIPQSKLNLCTIYWFHGTMQLKCAWNFVRESHKCEQRWEWKAWQDNEKWSGMEWFTSISRSAFVCYSHTTDHTQAQCIYCGKESINE